MTANIFNDGFDHYATADLLASLKWAATGSGMTIAGSSGRLAGGAWFNETASNYMTKSFSTNAQEWIVSFAIKPTSISAATAGMIFWLMEGSTKHIGIGFDTSGHLFVARNSFTTVLATTSEILSVDAWRQVECKIKVANSGGTVELRLDGSASPSINFSGDTAASANEYAQTVRLGHCDGSAWKGYLDDVSIRGDAAGTLSFWGNTRVDTLTLTGNGTNSDFTGSDADSTDNYLLVDDATPDADSTYVESDQVNDKDTYAHSALPVNPTTIYCMQVNGVVKADDAGARSVKLLCRSGSTDYAGDEKTLTTGYVCETQVWETDPNTSSTWLKAGIDASEIGVEVYS